jgi:hypothetical protein
MLDAYTIRFAAAGLAYVRQVLGTRPYDEVAPLLMEIEGQRAHQERLAAASPAPPDRPKNNVVARPRKSPPRRGGARPSNGNGAQPPEPPAPLS